LLGDFFILPCVVEAEEEMLVVHKVLGNYLYFGEAMVVLSVVVVADVAVVDCLADYHLIISLN
jgi:hypothetical protein